MNDFGEELATSIACLPVSNQDTANLQWSVRVNGNSGFLFCSNYQRVWNRKEYKNVCFTVKLKGETLTIPSKPVKVADKTYFMWPFNQKYEGVLLKYATAQPVCKIENEEVTTCFFFEDDGIPAEYVFDRSTVSQITARNGEVFGDKRAYTVRNIRAGKKQLIEITGTNGKRIRFITLTAPESDNLWREKVGGKEYAFITTDGIKLENGKTVLFGEQELHELLVYPAVTDIQSSVSSSYQGEDGEFGKYIFRQKREDFPVSADKVSLLDEAKWITADRGNAIASTVYIRKGLSVRTAQLRMAASVPVKMNINGTEINPVMTNGYYLQDIKKNMQTGNNQLLIEAASGDLKLIASLEVEYENGRRFVYVSDETWFTGDIQHPVKILGKQGENGLPAIDTSGELYAYYKVNLPDEFFYSDRVVRLKINYSGDLADCFIGEQLCSDNFFNGLTYTIGIDRFRKFLRDNEMIIRIKAFEKKPDVYFEDFIDFSDCTVQHLKIVVIRTEYVSVLSFNF
jgi:hypothetical protein